MPQNLIQISLASLFLVAFPAGATTILASGVSPENHTYLVLRHPEASWREARNDLRANLPEFYLVIIDFSAENSFVSDLVYHLKRRERSVQYWLGAFQRNPERDPSSGWAWVSKEQWSYTNWDWGEPNDAQGIEDHATIYGRFGTWNDEGSALGRLMDT